MNVNLRVVFQRIWAMFQNGFTFAYTLRTKVHRFTIWLYVTSDIYSHLATQYYFFNIHWPGKTAITQVSGRFMVG